VQLYLFIKGFSFFKDFDRIFKMKIYKLVVRWIGKNNIFILATNVIVFPSDEENCKT